MFNGYRLLTKIKKEGDIVDWKAFRKQYNVSQYELARMLGVSRSAYRDVEYSKTAPSSTMLERLPKVQKQLENRKNEDKILEELELML